MSAKTLAVALASLVFLAICLGAVGVATLHGGDAVRLAVTPVDPPGSFRVGTGPYAVRVADLERDGTPETLSANLVDGSVTVLTGGAPGRPSRRIDVSAGGVPVALATLDVDGDGMLEVVAAVRNWVGTVALFRRDPDQGLLLDRSVWVYGRPDDIDAGDLDGDGRDEVAVALYQDALVVLDFDGSRGRPHKKRFGIPECGGRNAYGPDGVEVADADDDGHLDVAVVCYDTWSVHLLRGDGSGALGPPERLAAVPEAERLRVMRETAPGEIHPDGSPAGGMRKVYALDVDRDGHTDLLGVGDYGILLALFGSAQGFEPGRVIDTGVDGTNNLAAGDVDGDGKVEVFVTTGHEPTVIVLAAEALRAGRAEPHRVATLARTPESVQLLDLDHDGALDLVAAGEHASAITFLRGDGAGAFAPF